MFRMILYVLIAVGAVVSIPALRRRAAPPASQVWQHVAPLVRVVSTPIRASVTRREEAALVDQLRRIHDAGQKLPEPEAFQRWITASSSVNRDGWGNPYVLVEHPDGTLWVGSAGPDGESGTEDDIFTKCPW